MHPKWFFTCARAYHCGLIYWLLLCWSHRCVDLSCGILNCVEPHYCGRGTLVPASWAPFSEHHMFCGSVVSGRFCCYYFFLVARVVFIFAMTGRDKATKPSFGPTLAYILNGPMTKFRFIIITYRVKYTSGPRTCHQVPLRSTNLQNRNLAPWTC